MLDHKQQFNKILEEVVKQGASDLLIAVNKYPIFRIDNRLVPQAQFSVLTPEMAEGLCLSLLGEEQKKILMSQRDIDFSYSLDTTARFRANVYIQRGYFSAAFRLIPTQIPNMEFLNMPPILHEFTLKTNQGFFLVVGPSGQGKSTALAAMIDEVNHNRTEHIITIENPIEYLYAPDRSVIDQREIGSDATSFSEALRASFRQDPNVILVGEMRDTETIATAITAAETGHLVFSTLHTNNASQTIDRIIDAFPPSQQSQIRAQLAGSLLGILSRRLIPQVGGGRIAAHELLIANAAIRNLIRENKIHQIDLVIETSAEEGMISLNRSLADLVKTKKITPEHAEQYSLNPTELKLLLK